MPPSEVHKLDFCVANLASVQALPHDSIADQHLAHDQHGVAMQAKPRSFGAKQRDALRQAVAMAAGVPKIKVCLSKRCFCLL